MRRWLPVIIIGFLTACSSGGDSQTYYQLPAAAQPTNAATATQNGRLLWVEQVVVPDYLAGNGVVYQTTEVQYVIASENLWASPLDQQLRNTLVINLSNALPGWVVSSQPLGASQDTLSVNITGFHGRYDGRVVVSGEWLLKHRGRLIKRPFYIELKQHEDGYDAMVKQLATAWQQEAVAMAQAIAHQP